MAASEAVGIKAFLSYSSHDEEFVRSVADRLGRPYALIDQHEFRTGDDLISAMEAAVAASGIFVLFASRKALDSVWVKLEVNEARYQAAIQRIQKVLVFALDRSIHVSELPEWLQRAKFSYANAPQPVAREIQANLEDLVRERQHPVFVGRTKELAAIQERLAPYDGSLPPRTLLVAGLPGIGRRTVIGRVAKDLLSFPRLLVIRIESGDQLQDIAIKLADRLEPHNTATRFMQIVHDIGALPSDDALDRVVANLKRAIGFHELPVFLSRLP